MKVFLSWSGDQSRAVAEALRGWLKLVIQSVDPWMSGRDIEPGQRWSNTLADELSKSNVGIICLTPENVHKPWLNFEAGAIAKSVNRARLVPLLHGLTESDLNGPLGFFQCLTLDKDGVRSLVKMLRNSDQDSAMSDEEQLKVFDALWPMMDGSLQNIPTSSSTEKTGRKERSDRELLEEILHNVRVSRELTKENILEGLEDWVERLEQNAKRLDEISMKAYGGAGAASAAADKMSDFASDLHRAIDTIKKTYWL